MPLAVGSRLGPYEIQSAIGAGGMGEVYRARDTKLGRDVAIKVLPESYAADPERIARMHREAQVLAALNHPNIAAIHGFEDSGHVHALVLEFVDGETLADRIARGPMPLDEALPIAKQIAEALEAAHEQGIIHRDLKPANIKVRPDGTVKVLDFGLAKLVEPSTVSPSPSPLSLSPTITSPAMVTGVGVLLGTAAYMSPEQAKGRPADRRSDLWAFGVVLFEMLTGVAPFRREDVAETLAALLMKEPEFGAFPANTPAPIETLVRRCLRKNPRERLGDANAARLEIEDALHAPRVVPPQVTDAGGASRRLVRWAFPLVLVAAALVGAVMYWSRTPTPPQPIRFEIPPPDGWTIDIASSSLGAAQAPLAISPDGRRIVFAAVDSGGRRQLWIRALGSTNATPLAGTDGAMSPFWSPDSRFLGFFADAKLKKLDVAGGPIVVLCDAPDGRGASWSREDVIVFSPSAGPMKRVSASGGVPVDATSLQSGETRHNRPSFLPDGRHFFHYIVGPADQLIALASLDSSERKLLPIGADAMPVIYSQGHLLFVRDATLMAQAFDASRLELRGEPFPVAEQVQIAGGPSPFNAVFSVSDNGVLVYRVGAALTRTELTWVDREGKQIGTVGEPGEYGDLELSPDGGRLAVSVADSSAAPRDLWIYDVVRNLRTRFTFGDGNKSYPVWSPDGTRIAFAWNRDGSEDIYQKSSDGTGIDELLMQARLFQRPNSWSADGHLVFESNDTASPRLLALSVFGDRKPVPILGGSSRPTQARVSPDGRWIAYMLPESGRYEVYVSRFPTGDGRWQVSTSGGGQPRWRRDGRELFFRNGSKLLSADVNGAGVAFQVGLIRQLFDGQLRTGQGSSYDASADGHRFIVNKVARESAAPVSVVVNWMVAPSH